MPEDDDEDGNYVLMGLVVATAVSLIGWYAILYIFGVFK